MSKLLIINMTRITQSIPVVHADQKKDFVQLVPQGRTTLRPCMTISTRWLQSNPNTIKIVDTAPVVESILQGDE